MGLFKEHAHAFEAVAERQTRIYSDACDCGLPFEESDPPQEIKDLIFMVNDLKGSSLIVNKEIWKDGVAVKIRIGWEVDEGMECGSEYYISFNRIKKNYPSSLHKNCDAFIYVDISSYRIPYTD